MPDLISLEDFNRSRTAGIRQTTNQPNGIACPDCGKELVDPHPSHVLACNPPKTDVTCPSCGYRGYRYA